MQSSRSMPRSHRAKSLAHSKSCRPGQRKYLADVPASPSIGGQPARRVRCSANRPVKSRRSRELPLRKRARRRESPRDFRNQDVDILGGPGYDAQQTERSSSNDDGIEPEPSVSKKLVERLDGLYRSHGISISDTSLIYQRDFLGTRKLPDAEYWYIKPQTVLPDVRKAVNDAVSGLVRCSTDVQPERT